MPEAPGRTWLASLLLLFAGFASAAQAQVVVDQASTVGESESRGFADVIRSQGQYNLQTSQAMINAEQARSADPDAPVRAPIKPKPHPRSSGTIAVPEQER